MNSKYYDWLAFDNARRPRISALSGLDSRHAGNCDVVPNSARDSSDACSFMFNAMMISPISRFAEA